MGHNCSHHDDHASTPNTPQYQRALWIAFGLNITMCLVEGLFGFFGNSASLHADALDFFADSTTYAITLFALSMTPAFRSWVGMAKGIAMLLFGIYVAYEVISRLISGDINPSPFVMSWVGAAALTANLLSAFVLLKFRDGDSNVRAVWLCTRNDAVGNILIITAAVLIYWQPNIGYLAIAIFVAIMLLGFLTKIPHLYIMLGGIAVLGPVLYLGYESLDLVAATTIASLALWGAISVMKQSYKELKVIQ